MGEWISIYEFWRGKKTVYSNGFGIFQLLDYRVIINNYLLCFVCTYILIFLKCLGVRLWGHRLMYILQPVSLTSNSFENFSCSAFLPTVGAMTPMFVCVPPEFVF